MQIIFIHSFIKMSGTSYLVCLHLISVMGCYQEMGQVQYRYIYVEKRFKNLSQNIISIIVQ